MKSLRLLSYFKESKEELKKVTWPSKQDTMKYTLIVVVLSLLIAAFFGGFDWVLNLGLEKLIEVKS